MVVVSAGLALLGPRGMGMSPTPLHPAFGRGSEIVLVHGLGSNASHWLPTARALARHHHVTLVQLPGHGASGMPEPFSLERAVEGLDQALRDRSGPVILVGHSIGGLVAVAEALDHPERVSGLVLVETSLKPLGSPEDRAAMGEELDTDYRGLLHRAYLSFGRDSAQGEYLFAEAATEDSANMRRWIRLALTADLSDRAADLTTPVLAVLSDRSWPLETPWEETAAEFGYAKVDRLTPKRMMESGHFVMLDQPAALARIIERFAANAPPELLAVGSR